MAIIHEFVFLSLICICQFLAPLTADELSDCQAAAVVDCPKACCPNSVYGSSCDVASEIQGLMPLCFCGCVVPPTFYCSPVTGSQCDFENVSCQAGSGMYHCDTGAGSPFCACGSVTVEELHKQASPPVTRISAKRPGKKAPKL